MTIEKSTTKVSKANNVTETTETTTKVEKIKLSASFYQLDALGLKCYEYTIKQLEFNADGLSVNIVLGSVINKFFKLYKIARKHGNNLGLQSNKDVFVNITNENNDININSSALCSLASVKLLGRETLTFKFRLNKHYESAVKLGNTLLDLITEFTTPFEAIRINDIGGNARISENELREANKLLKLELRTQRRAEYEALSLDAKIELERVKAIEFKASLIRKAEKLALKQAREQFLAELN